MVNGRLFEGASPGIPGDVGPITPHTTPGWQRPGPEWETTIRFVRPGCWVLRLFAGEVEGSFTFRVN